MKRKERESLPQRRFQKIGERLLLLAHQELLMV